jgi:hypothetical protein
VPSHKAPDLVDIVTGRELFAPHLVVIAVSRDGILFDHRAITSVREVIVCDDKDIVTFVRHKGPGAASIRTVCRRDRSGVPTPRLPFARRSPPIRKSSFVASACSFRLSSGFVRSRRHRRL